MNVEPDVPPGELFWHVLWSTERAGPQQRIERVLAHLAVVFVLHRLKKRQRGADVFLDALPNLEGGHVTLGRGEGELVDVKRLRQHRHLAVASFVAHRQPMAILCDRTQHVTFPLVVFDVIDE